MTYRTYLYRGIAIVLLVVGIGVPILIDAAQSAHNRSAFSTTEYEGLDYAIAYAVAHKFQRR